ncbi:MAG: YbbR-like domain-containing protein [Paludibacter sp.]|nr:YbbR-like domain-containing protein [Paludibacter sp.]
MAGPSKSRLLRYLTLKLKSFLLSKDVLSFLVFLLLSATFWFVNTLNKEREQSLNIPIEYKGFSKDLMFVEKLPQHICINVKDLGINLWKYVGNKPGPVVINFNQKVNESGLFEVSYSDLLTKVSEKLFPTSSIVSIYPETINSRFIRLHSKTLPVELNSNITLADQFMLSKPIEVIPSEVKVYGPKSLIENLKTVKTENLLIEQLKDTVSYQLPLKPLESVSYSVDQVTVRASAEMFTEKIAYLPVQIINNPENLSILSFPAEIKTIFNIAVTKFKSFENNDIQLVIDFNEIKKGDATKKRLKIINNKPYITNIRIQPEEVEFLLEEK